MQTPRTEFAQALKAVATERGLDADVILDTIKQAIIAAYRRDAKERGEETDDMDFDVDLNSVNGEARVFAWPAAPTEIIDEVVTLKEETPEETKARTDQRKDITPPGFGRIAAQTAKQVIHQKIREAEKDAILGEFSGRVGSLVSGMILRFDGANVRVDIGRTEAIMPAEERIPTERLNSNQRMTFLLKEIKDTPRGRDIILSRADPVFVEKLFGREVPEIASGSVLVKKIVREPGIRTKIVVASIQSGVDPVGSCVGQKGVRVQAVTNEIGGERVDIIPFSEDLSELIKSALSPAENLSVTLDKKGEVAIVKAPSDQLSLVIGKEGQNVRLAAKLTGVKIEVEGDESLAPKVEVKEESKEVQETETEIEKVEKPSSAKATEGQEKEPESEIEKAEKKENVVTDSDSSQAAPAGDEPVVAEETPAEEVKVEEVSEKTEAEPEISGVPQVIEETNSDSDSSEEQK